jgi:hypothetical protein
MTKEVLESRYMSHLNKNSQVRQKALKAHSESKNKVPRKFADASRR